MKWLILLLIFLMPEVSNSDGFQIKIGGSGNSFRYSSNGFHKKQRHSIHTPKPEKPIHKPSCRPKHGWYGPPYYLPPYNVFGPFYGRSRNRKTVIIKEKEIVREVRVIIQQPAPEKVWVSPVYETKIIKGHFINGIKETIEDGYRTFIDDPEQNIWVPQKEIRVVKTPGYYK